MNYTAAADKFERESDILLDSLEALENIPGGLRLSDRERHRDGVELALAQAKRVRTASTVLVRELAQQRDELQTSGGHKP